MVFDNNSEQYMGEIILFELKKQFPDYIEYLEGKGANWKNGDVSSLIHDLSPESIEKAAVDLHKQFIVDFEAYL